MINTPPIGELRQWSWSHPGVREWPKFNWSKRCHAISLIDLAARIAFCSGLLAAAAMGAHLHRRSAAWSCS